MALQIDVISIFPGMLAGVVGESIVGRAVEAGLVNIDLTDLREFANDKHRSVDDRPYGGGPGMVFKPEPVFDAVEHVLGNASAGDDNDPGQTRKIILTPQGRRLDQPLLKELASASRLVLLCGHYEGFDERIFQGLDFESVSIGDYVLSGGELPALVIIDGVVRLLPGALGHPDSSTNESFEDGLLDHPHYTRPYEFRGMSVPEVLRSGNHADIAEWRRQKAVERTLERREDLVANDAQETAGRRE